MSRAPHGVDNAQLPDFISGFLILVLGLLMGLLFPRAS